MSGEGLDLSEEAPRRGGHGAPYTSHHPVPTIQRYQEHRKDIGEGQKQAEHAQQDDADESKFKRAFHSAKAILTGKDEGKSDHEPYKTVNRNEQNGALQTGADPSISNGNLQASPNHDSPYQDPQLPQNQTHHDVAGDQQDQDRKENRSPQTSDSSKQKHQQKSAAETAAGLVDPRKKRKAMKHSQRDDGGREVTDPVTHLPVVIHDQTKKDLNSVQENETSPNEESQTTTGVEGAKKSKSQLELERREMAGGHENMEKLFPPPSFEDAKAELVRTYQLALTFALGSVVVLATLALLVIQIFDIRAIRHQESKGKARSPNQQAGQINWSFFPLLITTVLASAVGFAIIIGVRGWLGKKVEEIWKDEVWDAARKQENDTDSSNDNLPESVAWMNKVTASVWPLMNPDLFTSLADMLEDVMQASLPKMVKMVSIDDYGQGSESFRILGIRWLPTGAAGQSVDKDGKLKPVDEKKSSDRSGSGNGEEDQGADDNSKDDANNSKDEKKSKEQKQQDEQEQQAIREGMEAEQGDFINMELAFAYRARSSGKSLKAKAKNAHLYLRFWLPGGIPIPVWVELRGIVGTMRLRLQLIPDPPFFALCTLTFLGQPQADLSCVPLSKHSLNLMNVPLISSFVQTSVDAALAEYVAPKSLTLDLKDMIVGDDFKKDTAARGVVLIYIKKADGFKQGDVSIGPGKDASDSYVTVSWGKFGKPVASTRIIVDDEHPIWNEWSHIMVTAEEVNAQEKLRLQLWDSDKFTADDDLGRVEVDLKELIHSPRTKNKFCDREDRFTGEDADEQVPGTLSWRVGFFAKTTITQDQLEQQTVDEHVRSVEDLKREVNKTAEQKLKEATAHDESKETGQQKQLELKQRETDMIISAPPPKDYLSGIFSIQIHNITGLEVARLNKKDKDNSGTNEDEAEQTDDMPTSYCTIILNHHKIYRTRTKPKNAKPFFNAGTERFIKDWRTTEVVVSVRDSRERENDGLLGIVYLPLRRVFDKRSQLMETFPLVGGVGYGRIRISMVFRSIELHLPPERLGWDYGTLEVRSPVKAAEGLPHEFLGYRIKIKSNLSKAKMFPSDNEGEWQPKQDRDNIFLAVRKRYASALCIEFRKSSIGPDKSPAFAVFWLSEIPDEEEKTIKLDVWRGGKDNLKRATTCCDYKCDEQPLGQIEVTMKFWRGLSGYHKPWANRGRNEDIRDVMEVLDTVNDEKENDDVGTYGDSSDSDQSDYDDDDDDDHHGRERNGHPPPKTTSSDGPDDQSTTTKILHALKPDVARDHDDQDSSSDPSDNHTQTHNPIVKAKDTVTNVLAGHNDPNDGTRGVMSQIRDYKDHHKQLHRQHKGVMQWKGARTLDWMVGGVRRVKGKVGDVFRHEDEVEKKRGVETEV